MFKFYFITYQAKNRYGSGYSYWQRVIDMFPMEFILNIEKEEYSEPGNGNYYNFVIINTMEITQEEYEYYKDKF